MNHLRIAGFYELNGREDYSICNVFVALNLLDQITEFNFGTAENFPVDQSIFEEYLSLGLAIEIFVF